MKSAFASSGTAHPIFRRRIGTEANHWKLLIRTTSLPKLPRVSASCPPSGDHSKSKISPDSKFVICFGGPPVSFCDEGMRHRDDGSFLAASCR